MATYEANFELDTLYRVADAMASYSSQVDYAASRIEMETRLIESMTQDSVITVETRLKEEEAKLASIRAQLEDAEWHLNNCQHTDDEGNSTGEYEYWTRVVNELIRKEADQEEVVEYVREAYYKVKRLAEDAEMRSIQIRSLTQSYRGKASAQGSAASAAIRHCADAMLEYWNLNL